MDDKRMMVAFPRMHAGAAAVSGVLRLDPGLAPDGEGVFTPADLPLDGTSARAWLERAQGYASLFRKPGELLSAYMAGGGDFYSGTAQAIAGELRAMERGQGEDAGAAGRVRAQCALLLAQAREGALMEAGGLDSGVEKAWDDLGRGLGLDEEDAAELAGRAPFLPDLDVSPYAAPEDWRPVLEGFLRLLPAEAALYVDEADVVESWIEAGVAFAPAGDEDLPGPGAEGLLAARATGYELLGRNPGDDPALAARRLVVAPVSAAGTQVEEQG